MGSAGSPITVGGEFEIQGPETGLVDGLFTTIAWLFMAAFGISLLFGGAFSLIVLAISH